MIELYAQFQWIILISWIHHQLSCKTNEMLLSIEQCLGDLLFLSDFLNR